MGVRTEKSGDVWTVVLDRSEARNAVDTEHSKALYEAFLAFDAGPAKVAVLWGAGGDFCAGWDLKLAASLQDTAKREAYLNELDIKDVANLGRGAMGPSRMALTKPVIGAIEGSAVAGGMELALWCDVRVMAETAFMGVFCRRWGISLMDGGTVRLPRLVGQGRALEMAMTGRKIEARECERFGLCERVVPRGTAREAAETMAHDIARFPQEAMLADRQAIIATRGMPVPEALEWEWRHGQDAIRNEGTEGAGRFCRGVGRHGDFDKV